MRLLTHIPLASGPPIEGCHQRKKGFKQVAQFDAEQTLNVYECIYQQALTIKVQS